MYEIDGYSLTIDDVAAAIKGEIGSVQISQAAIQKCEATRSQINRWLQEDAPVVYGVNTGLGNLKNTRLSVEDHLKWNKTIAYPHAVGMGNPLHPNITRASLLVRSNVLARSFSAVRPELIKRMLAIFNAGISPVVLELGSTGLSDLGPLSQSAMVVAGLEEAEVFYKGKRIKARTCFKKVGLASTFELECKEVLSQMNGSSMTQAIAVLTFYTLEKLMNIQKELDGDMDGMYAIDSKEKVYAAINDSMAFVSKVINFENNITCDNPLLFKKDENNYEPVMGCNCSNTQVGFVLDLLNVLIADASNYIYALICLMEKNRSSLVGVRKLASSLLTEIKTLCVPASADSIPTKGNQEDHVEFSYGAARKAMRATKIYRSLLSCEISALVESKQQAKSTIMQAITAQFEKMARVHNGVERLEAIEKYLEGFSLIG